MRRIAFGILLIFLANVVAPPLLGPARAAPDQPIRREILALYDSRDEPDIENSRLHRFAEMPLNHLGFVLRYQDVAAPLPDLQAVGGYAGVLTWFSGPLKNPFVYLGWARSVVRQGTKYVVLGDPGADATSEARAAINGFLGGIGLSFTGKYVDPTYGTRVVTRDPMIGFERDLDRDLPPFSGVTQSAPDVTTLLEVEAPERDGGRRSVLVALSPRGGFAAFGYEFLHELPTVERGQWIINPFDFFRGAFGGANHPIPDVTTVSGRRLYFSHVDGDGWNNVTTLEHQLPRGLLSSEVMLKELIEPFPDLPITVGLIAGDTDPRLGGLPNAADIARRIFALPQVEVGSHTYTHPFNWGFFAAYERNREVSLVANNNPNPALTRYLRNVGSALGLGHRHGESAYVAGSADMPRSYMRDPFVLDNEISGSLDAASALAPKGKKAMVLQWSGDTMPFEEAIKTAREAGVVNINGGDSRFDTSYPSVAYVPPIGRVVGRQRQIYAVNSNENTYTNGWTSDFAGQQRLTQTLENTELPRRLKGANVYYHVYSAERRASLEVIKALLNATRSARVTPIATSHYAAMADGFFTTAISSLGSDTWRLENRGALETVRFDTADSKMLDLGRSLGVLGQSRHGGSLYIALDPAEHTAIVALKPVDNAGAMTGPSLVESRWRLQGLARGSCEFRHTAQGFGPGDFVWEAVPVGSYRIAAIRDGAERWSAKVDTDGAGRLAYTVPVTAIEPVEIRVECVH